MSLQQGWDTEWMIIFSQNTGCQDKLGMENGDIPDANIKASQMKIWNGKTYHAHQARLNSMEFTWLLEDSSGNIWIQADIGYQTCVTGVITQGDGGTGSNPDWFTKLKVSTFLSTTADSPEVFIEENGTPKVSIDVERVRQMLEAPATG